MYVNMVCVVQRIVYAICWTVSCLAYKIAIGINALNHGLYYNIYVIVNINEVQLADEIWYRIVNAISWAQGKFAHGACLNLINYICSRCSFTAGYSIIDAYFRRGGLHTIW